jgi:hypothetical protein
MVVLSPERIEATGMRSFRRLLRWEVVKVGISLRALLTEGKAKPLELKPRSQTAAI